MRSRHKIISTNIKGFCEFGLEADVLFHRIVCNKEHFYSAFNFPTILRHRMGLCSIDARLGCSVAAVSPRLPPALNKYSYLVTHDVITACGLHSSAMSEVFFPCFGLKVNFLQSVQLLLYMGREFFVPLTTVIKRNFAI